jgi:hypothetical protein
MEAATMKPTLIVAALLLALGVAQASDVFMTKDAQGRPVYTDRPDTLPAQRLDVKSATTDTVEVQQRYAEEQKQMFEASKASDAAAKAAKENKAAAATIDADRAKRCQDTRDHYLHLMNAQRLYEDADGGERRYLTDAELDAAREDAKKVMDEFCAEP